MELTKNILKSKIEILNGDCLASRKQIQDIFGVPKKTLSDNINKLKTKGLIVGAEIRPKMGKAYEVYDLEEVVSIGLTLNTEKAIEFHKWSRTMIKNQLLEQQNKLEQQQKQLDHLWDKEDLNDLYYR